MVTLENFISSRMDRVLLQTVSFFSAKNYLGERKRQIYQNYLFSLLLLSSPSLFLFRTSLV